MAETPSTSRRALLTTGTASLVALAGCSGFGAKKSDADDHAHLSRILLQSGTGKTEPMFLNLVYAPRDDSTAYPVIGTYDAPPAGETRSILDFEGTPGFYSLTALSENHDNTAVVSFNSYGDAVGSDNLQFEIGVKENGDVWSNLGEAGDSIAIPGQ